MNEKKSQEYCMAVSVAYDQKLSKDARRIAKLYLVSLNPSRAFNTFSRNGDYEGFVIISQDENLDEQVRRHAAVEATNIEQDKSGWFRRLESRVVANQGYCGVSRTPCVDRSWDEMNLTQEALFAGV